MSLKRVVIVFCKHLLMTNNTPANWYIGNVSTQNITYGESEDVVVSASVPNNYYVIITINDEFTSNALNFNEDLLLYVIDPEYMVVGSNKVLVELYTNNDIKIDQVIQYFEVEKATPVIDI